MNIFTFIKKPVWVGRIATVLCAGFFWGSAEAQEKTLAVLGFFVQPPVAAAQGGVVTNGVYERFKSGGSWLTLEPWLVDTMLVGMGQNVGNDCSLPECLLATGKILSVNMVAGGAISKKDETIVLVARLADVDANTIVRTAQIEIPLIQKRILESDIDSLYKLLVSPKATAFPPVQPVAQADAVQDSTPAELLPDPEHKRGPWFLIPTSVAAVGIGAAVFYFTTRAEENPMAEPDTGISLDYRPAR